MRSRGISTTLARSAVRTVTSAPPILLGPRLQGHVAVALHPARCLHAPFLLHCSECSGTIVGNRSCYGRSGRAGRAWDCVQRASEHARASNLAFVAALRTAVDAGDVTIAILTIDKVVNLAQSTASKDLVRTHRFVRVTPRTPASWAGDRLELVDCADATDLEVVVQEREQLFAAALRAARDERVVIAAREQLPRKAPVPVHVTVSWSASLPGEEVVRVWVYDNPNDDEVARLLAAGASDRQFGQKGKEAAFNVKFTAIIRSAQNSC
jgi:hypothetical protein